jgi:hypothetical protein
MTVLAYVVDPDGRRVDLTVERWEHIVDNDAGHPELDAYRGDVMLAVSEPHEQRPGRRDNEWWYFRRNASSRWLQMVVAYGCRRIRGRVRSASRDRETAWD